MLFHRALHLIERDMLPEALLVADRRADNQRIPHRVRRPLFVLPQHVAVGP